MTEQPNVIEQAEKAAARLEQANKTAEELVKRQEAAQARNLLGGKSEAGAIQPPPREETPKEYVKRIMSGVV